MTKTNFDILLGEAIDNLYERTKAKLGNVENFSNEDGKIPFGISRDWSKAQPSLREVGMDDELVNDILKRFEQSSFGALRQAKNGDWIMEGITWELKLLTLPTILQMPAVSLRSSLCKLQVMLHQFVTSVSKTVKLVLTA